MKKYIFFQLIFFFFMLTQSVAQIAGNWKPIGPILFPANVSGQINGIGRVSQIKFHPHGDSSKLYAVSASGGLWTSNDGAKSWQRTGTDSLPRMSCASVCIDYTNNQVIYLGTGDANYYGGGYGVWKSTDAGKTWNFSNSGMGNRLVVEILMHSSNNKELIAATDNGIYKSYDAGATWIAKKNGGAFTNMIFKPSPFPSTIYAATFDQFFRSTDMGETWSPVALPGSGITGGGRLAVSRANPDIVYVSFVGDYKASASAPVLRSTNSGQSFTIMKPAGLPNLNGYRPDEGGQGNYNYSMTADPYDANIVYITGHVVWKSVNGGVNWTQLTSWWENVHTDMHDVKISPYNSSKLFNVNDGGVWLSTDGGNNWTPKSNGLEATECYHAGQSRLRKDMAYIGTQDNGELYFSNNAWVTNRGGDVGSKIVLSYQDEAMAYYLDDGTRRRLNYFANSWAEPDFGNKETAGVNMELEFTPLQKNVAFFSKKEVWRTDNLSSTSPGWKQLTNIKTPVKALAVSPVSANTLYVVTENGNVLRSDNALSASPSFVTLSAPAATNVSASITGIKTNQNVVYITCGSRVYRSADNGVSWTNISDGLPNVNIIKIHHDIYSNDESVYVGMATGVYYKNNSMSKWQNYSKGLPTIASINEFMIFNDSTTNSVLRVAFWGRGVWETPLSSHPAVSCAGTGSILREQWDNINGIAVSAIPVTTSPSSTGLLTKFEAVPDIAESYGSRIRGYICAPLTGNYTFWIASDDESELWLSTNDNPANKVKLAYVTSYVHPRDWEAQATQKSVPVFLVAGQKYYIEALQKDGGGPDHLAVGWQLPTGDMERPIPGNRLIPIQPIVSCAGAGTILREQWDNINGNAVSAIPVTTPPSTTGLITQFEAAPDIAEAYGSRVRGYICPPYTGNYTFWIASDDESELWLSTNDNPANKVKLAYLMSYVDPRNWEAQATQRSVPVFLVAGQKYYIEALQKDGGGGDHLAVGWQLPTGDLERPIPGNRLLPVETPLITCTGAGTILREQWDNIGGIAVSAIPVTTSPSSTGLLTQFEAVPDIAESYGSRIRGYICAPLTGNYTFWIASDDESELWLSTNDNPANKVKLAYVTSYVHPRDWEAQATQKSVPVFLVAGQKYYIEALQKDGGGPDHLAVGWQLPTGGMERPIPGNRLLPFAATPANQSAAGTSAALTEAVFKNFPNPFSQTTTIEFNLTKKERVSLVLYDIQGNKVADIYHGNLGAGKHTIPFNAQRLTPGNYICRLITKERSATIKMIRLSMPKRK
ncbi:T9SS type A sorting domain-containing protein [Niastella caeni]|uniref:T9SS type A sorting domain-containing protein n=1 Tax=Niastella caeni TaxID=2569763 RepID=A0A4V4GZV2_9BACT|nr:PA14 domain-containing protein [Niastella caeni]THU34206.1 T9SS type A sorting domain-containing protein [Niastella caeni]